MFEAEEMKSREIDILLGIIQDAMPHMDSLWATLQEQPLLNALMNLCYHSNIMVMSLI